MFIDQWSGYPNCCIGNKFAWNHPAAYEKFFLALPESSCHKSLVYEQVFLNKIRHPFKFFTLQGISQESVALLC